MRPGAKKLSLFAGLVFLAAAFVAPANAAQWGGIVVGKETTRHAIMIADRSGVVRTVRAGPAYKLRVGTRVSVSALRLTDGTFRSTKIRTLGRGKTATVRGVVLRFLKRSYLLGTGESVVVIQRKIPKRTLQRTLQGRADQPTPGANVVVGVSIDQSGALSQQSVQSASPTAEGARMEVTGALTALTLPQAPNPGSVAVTAQGMSFPCAIPANLPGLAAFQPQAIVEMECTLVGGAWTLDSLSMGGTEVEDDDGDEQEVTGEVTALTPGTSITVAGVTCTLPSGFDTAGINAPVGTTKGSIVELECVNGVVQELELEHEEDDDEDEDEDEGADD